MRPFTAAAAALIALGAAVPAQAADGAPTRERGFFLSISGAENSWVRGVMLRCEPEPKGPHPQARKACEAIHRAKADFGALADDPRVCTKQFDPVTATAVGTYRDRLIAWRKTYANACEMHVDTGHVFRF